MPAMVLFMIATGEQTGKLGELLQQCVEFLDKKDVINMTVTQVIDTSYSMEGDEFFANVTSDVSGDDGVIIPKGSIAHGKIMGTGNPGKLGKQAWVEMTFDYIVTPDGREIPIEGSMTTKLHPAIETTKIIAQDIGYHKNPSTKS